MAARVTVEDLETGETEQATVGDDDYFILALGKCRVSSIQVYPAAGTEVVTIKGCCAPKPLPNKEKSGE